MLYNFIKVTNKDNGKLMLINLNAVRSIHEDYSGITDTVYIETEDFSYGVLESMDFFKKVLGEEN